MPTITKNGGAYQFSEVVNGVELSLEESAARGNPIAVYLLQGNQHACDPRRPHAETLLRYAGKHRTAAQIDRVIADPAFGVSVYTLCVKRNHPDTGGAIGALGVVGRAWEGLGNKV